MNGFVYFITPEAVLHRQPDDEGRVVKIGFTKSRPEKRLSALQTGCPLPLKLWAYCEGTYELERAFHETFAELRLHGEWFMVADKLRGLLGYLGEEPHVGNRISEEQMGVAIFDNVFCDQPPHPSIKEKDWVQSARPECLAGFFPEEWRERIEWA